MQKKQFIYQYVQGLQKKKLPDGRNAHVNIMNNLQWIKIIKKHKKKDFKIFIRFDENTKLNII